MMNASEKVFSKSAALDHRLGLILVALLCAVAISPVLFVQFPAMPDYPGYVARLYLVAANGAPEVNPFYEIVRSPISNLAFDLLVPLLAPLTGVPLATKAMFVASECLVVSGAMAIEFSTKGRHEIAGFVALASLYCFPFAIGLLNFELGAGLALWGIGCWSLLSHKSHIARYVVHWAFTCALFAAHFFALGIYGLAVGILEAHAAWQRGGISRADFFTFSMLACPAVVLLGLTKLFGGALGGTGGNEWLLSAKALWVVYFLNGYSTLLSGCGLVVIIALILFLRVRKSIALSSPGVWLGAGCFVVFMIMPIRLSGSYYADARMVLAAALIVPSFIYFTNAAGRRARWSVVAVLTIMAAASAAVTLQAWLTYQRGYVQLLESFNRLERFSYVLVAKQDEAGAVALIGDPFRHAPTLAAAYAGALVPSLFAIRGSQPIRLREKYQEYDFVQAGLFDPVPISVLSEAARGEVSEQVPRVMGRWREKFDYLYVLGSGTANPFPDVLTETAIGDHFVLYRIRKSVVERQ